MRNQLFAIVAIILLSVSSCKKEEKLTGTGPVMLEFENIFGDELLNLGNTYTTQNSEQVTLSTFNYYVSNFVLVADNGSEYVVPKNECYRLVRQDVAATHSLTLNNVPAGKYTQIKFIIGVDSLKSTASASERTGDLDVATNSDMYWMWNSGYIFYKIEGTSPSAPLDTPSGTRPFFYHIGGYGGYSSATINNIKTITLSSADAIVVGSGKSPEVHITADAKEVFGSPTPLLISAHPGVMFAAFSTTISENYADMFKVEHVHN